MTNNMGTPAHPEGLPHFSVKALMAHKVGWLCGPSRHANTLHFCRPSSEKCPSMSRSLMN